MPHVGRGQVLIKGQVLLNGQVQGHLILSDTLKGFQSSEDFISCFDDRLLVLTSNFSQTREIIITGDENDRSFQTVEKCDFRTHFHLQTHLPAADSAASSFLLPEHTDTFSSTDSLIPHLFISASFCRI